MGKGSGRRPQQITQELADLKWKLAFGKLSDSEKQRVKQEIARLEKNVPD